MDKKKIIEKIKKLYALGTSPEKAEAELAISKAHELLVRHNLSMKDLEPEEKEFIQALAFEGKTNRPSWQRDLFCIICNHFMVHPIVQRKAGSMFRSGNNCRRYAMVGDLVNVELANYTLSYLLTIYKKLANKYMKESKEKVEDISEIARFMGFHQDTIGDRIKMRNSFYHGLNYGVRQALDKQVQKEQEEGLIVVEDLDLKKHVANITKGTTSSSSTKSDLDPHAVNAGVQAGVDIQIRGGISGQEATESNKAIGYDG